MKHAGIRFAIITIAFYWSALPQARGQVLYGGLVGTITDSSGAVVSGATVTITSRETSQVRTTATGGTGLYSFADVLPGQYEVKAEAKGFRTTIQTGIPVSVNTISRADFVLALGQVTETVTVTAAAAALQTDKPDVHVELATKELTDLPLPAYRNFQSLMNLVPGSTPGTLQNSINDTPQRDFLSNVNGTNGNGNNVHLDGALNKMNIINSHIMYVPPAESIETVNISTNAFDAEQGMTGGAAITVVTKSGGNQFHGSVFAFNSNNALQSRNFFFLGKRTPKSIDNIDGFTLGGPIRRNKLFFFGDWEGLREGQNFSQTYTVATAAQRTGDFSAYNTNIYDPATGDNTGKGRTPFPGAIVPLNRQSSITRQLQGLVPLPNQSGVAANFFNSGTAVLNRDNYDFKTTWNRTDKNTIWGKYGRMSGLVNCDPSLGAAGGTGLCNPSNPKPGQANTLVQIATLGTTYVITPTLLVDGTLGYSRMTQQIRGPFFGQNFGLDTLKIPGTNGGDIRASGQPGFDVTSYSSMGDDNAANPAFRTDMVYTYTSNVSWTRGSHQMRFGFELVDFQQNDWQPNITGGPRGLLTFDGAVTALSGGASPNQYNSYAAFLLGMPQSVSKALQYYSPQTAREWQYAWYAQDRWQATQKLTVTLGVRWEYYPNLYRANEGLDRYDWTTNNVLVGGRGGVPRNVGVTTSKRLLAPRAGLAYRLDTKTVIRSGYGISADPTTVSGTIQRPYPLVVGKQFTGPNSFIPFDSVSDGIPPIVGPDVSSGQLQLPPNTQTQTQAAGLFHRGYIQSWNLIVERKLPGDLVGSVGYVGTHTTRQIAYLNINAGSPGLGIAGQPIYARFGDSATINLMDPGFSAEYNSLQASASRRFTRGLFMRVSYTFSRAIDFTDSSGGSLSFNTPSQVSRNRALAGYDRTHILQASWAYALPFGPGKAWVKGKGVLPAIVKDWEVNGIFSAYSGSPFTVSASSASLNAPGNTQTADQILSEVTKPGGIGLAHPWFDPAAFAPVTAVRFGNVGRNTMRGPGVVNLDASVFRTIPFTERIRFQIRGEAFNATNTPHFDNPAASVSTSSTFGRITTAGQGPGRTFRLAARLSF
jgi:hypothetical protein